jgi:1-acyl-sn-glycerol-3-phosphate acyltransferase
MPSIATEERFRLLPEATSASTKKKPSSAAQAAYERAKQAIDRRSTLVSALFGFIFERSLKRSFHAVRLVAEAPPPSASTPRLVIYSNHPSWWDPVTYVSMGRQLFPGRPLFAPMEEAMLVRYPFMAGMGAFPVSHGSKRGAVDFLATSEEILKSDQNILLIACQGHFADARERPLKAESGIAHLASIGSGISFAPLAIEYVFWVEKRPELLLRFGPLINGETLKSQPIVERLEYLRAALEKTMDALAQVSIARDETAFTTILSGASAIDPVYDAWRRFKAFLSGRQFRPEHGDRP